MSIIKNTEELNNLLDAVQKLPVKKDEQEKVVDITENGTTVVTPDEGMTLGGVTVNVAIESGGGEDIFTALINKTATELIINDTASLAGFRLPCSSLKKFSAPYLTGIDNYSFYGANAIEYFDFGRITSMTSILLTGKHWTTTVILRNTEKVVTLDSAFSNAHSITKDDYISGSVHFYCCFYVPKSLIEEYKVATNWSNYANRFRAIEDYPEITGGVI
jgi:hypothetical protein